MATTATGTFTHCGTDQFFSLQYTCTGPNCNTINDFPNTTCTASGPILSCTNGVTCPGPTNYTSKFTFTQPKTLVSQSYDITYGCQDVLLTNDGTTGGTKITVNDIPGCVSNTTSPSSSSVSSVSTSASSSSVSSSTAAPIYVNTTTSAVRSPSASGSSATLPIISGSSHSNSAAYPTSVGGGLGTIVTVKDGVPTTIYPPSTSVAQSTSAGGGLATIVTVIDGVTTTICPSASQHEGQAPSSAGATYAVSSPDISVALPISPYSSAPTVQASYASSPPNSIPVGGESVAASTGSTAVQPVTSASPIPSKPLVVTSGAASRYQTRLATFYLMLFSFALLFQGTMALAGPPSHLPETTSLAVIESPQNYTIDMADLDLRAVSLTKIVSSPFLKNFANLLSEYLNGKIQNLEKNEELFAANLIAEVENAICSHFVSGAITKFAFYDAIEVCVATIITGTALAPPAELLAIFGAGLLCNYLFSELAPGVDAITNAFCDLIPKPCSADLLSDAKNCGKCGNVCATGTCKNGACTSNSCTGQVCSTFGPCGPGGTCVCASTAEGTGYCADGQTPCAGLPDCLDSSNCASGTICAVGSCCSRNVCVGATFCGGSSAPAITPRYLLQRSWTNATIADLGVWVD